MGKENNRRKQVFKKMSSDEDELDSLQKLQRLYRDFGLGKQFNPTKITNITDEDISNSIEEMGEDEVGDVIEIEETQMDIGEEDDEYVS